MIISFKRVPVGTFYTIWLQNYKEMSNIPKIFEFIRLKVSERIVFVW